MIHTTRTIDGSVTRYADDILLGFADPRQKPKPSHVNSASFCTALKLELSVEKTLITHANTEKARFLGYDIVTQQGNDQHDWQGKRCINGRIGLRVPAAVIDAHCAQYMQHGKPTHRPALLFEHDYTIVERYQAEYRGVVQYYLLAPTSRTSADYTGSCNSRSSAPWRISIKQAGAPC